MHDRKVQIHGGSERVWAAAHHLQDVVYPTGPALRLIIDGFQFAGGVLWGDQGQISHPPFVGMLCQLGKGFATLALNVVD